MINMHNEYSSRIKLLVLMIIILIALVLALCLLNHLNISLRAGLIGGITGALIAGFFTVFAVYIQHENTKRLEDEKEEKLVDSSIKAMQTELATLLEIYEQRIGKDIRAENNNDGIYLIFPIQLDYFTVYNTNAGLIGKIKHPTIRKKLVETYINAKGLIDSLRLNNQMCISFNNYKDGYELTKNDYYQRRSKEVKEGMIKYASTILFLDNKVKSDIRELNKLIDEKK